MCIRKYPHAHMQTFEEAKFGNPKITYLLGAGASCDSLPLGADLGMKIGRSVEWISRSIEDKYTSPSMACPDDKRPWPRGPIAHGLIEAFKWLQKVTIRTTVDNFARVLYIKQRRDDASAARDLKKLKAVLACYFLIEQSRISTDNRYDEFFGKILKTKEKVELPPGVQFVTWNYDILPEKSYLNCVGDLDRVRREITNGVFKRLNRIAGVVRPTRWNEVQTYHQTGFIELVQEPSNGIDVEMFIKLFDDMTDEPFPKLEPVLKFGWEEETIDDRIRQSILGTETLVVLGYSFPDFNGSIDEQLLGVMSESISEVVIQAPDNPTGNLSDIRQRFLDHLTGHRVPKRISSVDSGSWFFRPKALMPS